MPLSSSWFCFLLVLASFFARLSPRVSKKVYEAYSVLSQHHPKLTLIGWI